MACVSAWICKCGKVCSCTFIQCLEEYKSIRIELITTSLWDSCFFSAYCACATFLIIFVQLFFAANYTCATVLFIFVQLSPDGFLVILIQDLRRSSDPHQVHSCCYNSAAVEKKMKDRKCCSAIPA
jgi:hypothetical protein